MGSGVFCLGRAVGVFEAVYFMGYRSYFLSFITVLGQSIGRFQVMELNKSSLRC